MNRFVLLLLGIAILLVTSHVSADEGPGSEDVNDVDHDVDSAPDVDGVDGDSNDVDDMDNDMDGMDDGDSGSDDSGSDDSGSDDSGSDDSDEDEPNNLLRFCRLCGDQTYLKNI